MTTGLAAVRADSSLVSNLQGLLQSIQLRNTIDMNTEWRGEGRLLSGAPGSSCKCKLMQAPLGDLKRGVGRKEPFSLPLLRTDVLQQANVKRVGVQADLKAHRDVAEVTFVVIL